MDATTTTTYSWDFENCMVSATLSDESVVSFDYDPFGRRIRKVATATTIFVYDGPNIIEEVDSSGNALARYTMGLGIDEPLAMYRDSATHYYQADGLGSVTALNNSSGSAAASYTYDSFGNLTASTGSLVNSFRYTARELDTDVDLYFFRARYYDAHSGRFLSEDPLRILAGVNFFEYVQNNPTNLVDPYGLVGMQFKESWQRRQMGFLDRLMSYEGATNWGADITSQCVCTGKGWQLQLKITVYMKIWYVDDLALAHETKHARILKNMWGDTVREYEKFEETYPSQLVCEHYRRVLINNDYRGGAINDKFNYDYNQIDKAVGEPDQPWNRIKEWFGLQL